MDRGKMTALLLFNFSKKFDSVCNVTLFAKLCLLGFLTEVHGWFASYLSGRLQAVKAEGHTSTFLSLNKGVPQGSVLGPMLFSLFVNDIARDLGPGVFHVIYADDLQIYVQGRIEDLQATLRRLSWAAERIAEWATLNHLQINVSKTKAMVFGTPVFVNRFAELDINCLHFGHSCVPFVSSARSLGVVLDSKLNWKEHVKYICSRAHSLMYRLYHFRRSTTLSLRKHLVQALLFPVVDYCSLVYCNISNELNLKIQRVLNRGIRYIYGFWRDSRVTPYRRELGWLRAEGRRDYFAACFLYNLLQSGTPSYLANFFVARHSSRPVRGNQEVLLVPRFRTDCLKYSFHVTTTYLWNALPTHIRESPSLSIFKQLIIAHIFAGEEEHQLPV